MGTLSFSVTAYSPKSQTVQSTAHDTSGAHTTSTSATNVADAAGAISLERGQLIACYADVAMRVRFGGTAATSSTGHYIPATTQVWFDCTDAGTVSAIDVA